METPLRILHLEDDPVDAALVRETLEAGGFCCDVTRVDTEASFREHIERGGFHLILTDFTLPSFDGFSALKLAARLRPEVPFVFVSGTLDEEVAVESLKIGATDYVFKTKVSRIVPSVRRALREADERARRAEAERTLRATQAQLTHAARVMAVGEMAASIAHEVNQPLAGIALNGGSCLRWLSHDPPDLAKAREAAESIINEAERAGQVIARIRALTRKTTPEKERLDLGEILEQVMALARAELQRNCVVVRKNIPADLAPVLADRVQIQQLLLNLFLNAIDAMSGVHDRQRELTVSTEDASGQVLVTVRDNGRGIEPENRARIFDTFYTTKPNGMGMGLSISRSIVENHGGRLWAESGDGPGATFRFLLTKAG